MVSRIVTLIFFLFVSALLSAQGFPDAQKQPRMREQKSNQKKFAKRAKRHHVKRGTVYFQPEPSSTQQTPIGFLADKRSLPILG